MKSGRKNETTQTGTAKNSQEQPGPGRNSPERPGAPRSGQEQPGPGAPRSGGGERRRRAAARGRPRRREVRPKACNDDRSRKQEKTPPRQRHPAGAPKPHFPNENAIFSNRQDRPRGSFQPKSRREYAVQTYILLRNL